MVLVFQVLVCANSLVHFFVLFVKLQRDWLYYHPELNTLSSLVCLIQSLLLQSISAPGSGIWSDGKDKSDGAQAHTWNVEVLIDVLKELVSTCNVLYSWCWFNIVPLKKILMSKMPSWMRAAVFCHFWLHWLKK